MGRPITSALLWFDAETTGLDPALDNVLEVGAIVTDLDLTPISGYHEVIKPHREAIERIRGNEVVLRMHQESGLINDMRSATVTLEDAEQAIVQLLKETTFGPGEIALAGSGVGHFDQRLIRHQMPLVDKWLAYYVYDVGTFRRMLTLFSHGQNPVPPLRESFQDGFKRHRALADAQAHLAEAQRFRDWVQSVV